MLHSLQKLYSLSQPQFWRTNNVPYLNILDIWKGAEAAAGTMPEAEATAEAGAETGAETAEVVGVEAEVGVGAGPRR